LVPVFVIYQSFVEDTAGAQAGTFAR